MEDKTLATQELWSLFTLEKYYSKEVFDGMYDPGEGRDLSDPAVSRQVCGDGGGIAYPGGKKFAVCLTHDIDDVYPPLTHKLLSTAYQVKSVQPTGLSKLWASQRGGANRSPYRNFGHIMDLEESFGARSSFYFLLTDRDPIRPRYRVEDVESDIGIIADRGWEVGLHGGYYTFDSLEKIREEKRRLDGALGKPAVGYRNHHLRFKVPETWRHLAAAGFRYDTTIGINNAAGFMNGTCHPFRPYDLNRKQWIDILEIPLAIMDSGLFWQTRSPKEAFETSRRIIDRAEQYGGVVTVLWHNTSFSCPFRADWEKLYGKILAYCHAKDAWMTSGEEICKWSEATVDATFRKHLRPEPAPGASGTREGILPGAGRAGP